MTYISSGKFEKEMFDLFGPIAKREEVFEPLSFEQFSKSTRKEVDALYQLLVAYDLPYLCGLGWSDFYSIADHYDADAEELEEEYGVDDEAQRGFFLNTVEIFDDDGYPFITIGDDGVCVGDDSEWTISLWYDNFPEFLRFLVHLEAASLGKKNLKEVQQEFKEAFESFEGEMFVDRSIEMAKENESDANFENALPSEEVFDPKDLSFLFTGKLASMKRSEANERVAELGGQISKSVNQTLDVLVIGDDGSSLFGEGTKGSKQIKAEGMIEKGSAIKIISESLFLRL